jgi:hypothetical protein
MAVSSTPIARVQSLDEAAGTTGGGAIAFFLVGAVATVSGLLVFGWDPASMLPGAAIGTLVFSAQRYFFETAPMVPRGDVPPAPAGIEVERVSYDLSDVPRILVVLALGVPLAALIDVSDVGVGFLVGMPIGWGLADLVVFLRIRRWERAHGRRVLFDPEADSRQLRAYAGPPL